MSGFWHDAFMSRGFQVEYDPSHYQDNFIYYRRNDIFINYNEEDLKDCISPYFRIFYREKLKLQVLISDIWVSGSFATAPVGSGKVLTYFVSLSQFLFVLDNITEHKKLPLLVGIDWVSKLVAEILQEER